METITKTIIGGWSAYMPVTPEEMRTFEEAAPKGIIGQVEYKPLEVSTRAVAAGANIRFKCTAHYANGTTPLQWDAIVEIHSLEGKSVVVKVTPAE